MRLISEPEVLGRLLWPDVLAALEAAFRRPSAFQTPERVAMTSPQGGTFLTMPCLGPDGAFGVKQVSVLADNPARGLPTVQAHYTLFAPDGSPRLTCGATQLTRVRTAAVSAIAASHLAAESSTRLLVVGTGALAPWMAEAHLQVRPYQRIQVWGRDPAKSAATAAELTGRLAGRPVHIEATSDLETAARSADVITVATTATVPIIRGEWLTPDQHLDLVGAFSSEMAEADPDAVLRSDVVVDDRDAAATEAGDLIQAATEGWSFDHIRGDLSELVNGTIARGARPTLFKSVGLAFEDLVVASLLD